MYTGDYIDKLVRIIGDGNGDGTVNSSDLVVLKKVLLNFTIINDVIKNVCDINADGKTNILDFILLEKYILASLITLLTLEILVKKEKKSSSFRTAFLTPLCFIEFLRSVITDEKFYATFYFNALNR